MVWVGLVGDAQGMAIEVAVIPVSAGMPALQVVLVAKCELRNKSVMEEDARPCLIRSCSLCVGDSSVGQALAQAAVRMKTLESHIAVMSWPLYYQYL